MWLIEFWIRAANGVCHWVVRKDSRYWQQRIYLDFAQLRHHVREEDKQALKRLLKKKQRKDHILCKDSSPSYSFYLRYFEILTLKDMV